MIVRYVSGVRFVQDVPFTCRCNGVSYGMSSEFLHELLVSAVLSRMLVFGSVPFVCDLVSAVSGVLSVMSLVCDLASVVSGVCQ